jgi:hypothetical protein
MHARVHRTRRAAGLATVAVLLAMLAAPAMAQLTTSTIKGTVTAKEGPLEAAQVVAVDKTTGFQYPTITRQDGSFALAGLRPGTYEVSVAALSYKPASRTVQVLVGQSVDVRFEVTAESVLLEDVSVVGNLLQETRTSEIVTNVTQEQINLLPQNDRNFLNLANLAPGVKVSTDPFRKDVRALGQPGSVTNVFIDGVSYKNDVLEGGFVGQDASRGNPFPQNAVQEFQILTQNFKAEYEKAGTSIVAAVTRAGGNEFTGDVFFSHQPDSWVNNDAIRERENVAKPHYKRSQFGLNLGGPIIRDKLTFFVSYEANEQDRAGLVRLGENRPLGFDVTPFLPLEGNFASPFRSDLYFAKVSWQPVGNQTVDFTYYRRDESDRRGFGGENAPNINAFSNGEDVRITLDAFDVKHKWTTGGFLNEASVQWQDSGWNPTNISHDPQLFYDNFVRLGSRNGEQRFDQETLAFRDDLTMFRGKHTFKTGAVVSRKSYDGLKVFGQEGRFEFRVDTGGRDFDAPWQAFINSGDPSLSTDNTQFGVYFQDDWRITPRVELNLGVRWDYETDMLNNDFVTPPDIVAALVNGIPDPTTVDPNDLAPVVWNELTPEERANYFSTGSSRENYKDQFQPRLGLSFDIGGDGKRVLYAGAGRYYDRVLYNYGYDEKFRTQWREYRVCFVNDVSEIPARTDCPPGQAVVWDPAYLQPGALKQLIDSGQVLGTPEIFLIPNDYKVPYNDQYSVGYRHNWGQIQTDVSFSRIRGRNGFTHIFGNRRRDTGDLQGVGSGFSNLLLATSNKEYWYNGFFVKIERPFVADARWGFTVSYTHNDSLQRGNDAFSLDYFTVADFPREPSIDSEPDRFVGSGIVRLPWDLTLSTNLILSTGTGTDIFDATNGFGFYERVIRFRGNRPEKKAFILGDWWGFRQMDLRLQKNVNLPHRQSLRLWIEGFNIFDWDNFGNVESFIPPGGPQNNPNFGRGNNIVGPTRSFQAGIGYSF